ncbi:MULTISPECIES: hypothetical protein [Methylomonas]|uniref:Lipoprotein n=1 Tax=Methylomonas koyamae TaxID=702114 RepID=A0A177NV31_9GAMM|nr:hypothetical protein [Methylomonas koyamae]OAI21908.1 hypothetical protein A1355_02470 [Methylomonas koyamae]
MAGNVRRHAAVFALCLLGGVTGCASHIQLTQDANEKARNYAACREKANSLYAVTPRYPTRSRYPWRTYSPNTPAFRFNQGDYLEDGDLDVAAVGKLPCFRQMPPAGVVVDDRIWDQIMREREFLTPEEYFALRQSCGDKYQYLDECPQYQIRADLCQAQGRNCKLDVENLTGEDKKAAVNAYLRSLLVKTLRKEGRIDHKGRVIRGHVPNYLD